MSLSVRKAKRIEFEAGHTWKQGADRRRLMVESNRLVIAKAFDIARHAAAFEISPMRMKAQRDAADMLNHQSFLDRHDHADRDIGIPPQQIFDGVGENKFDLEPGVALGKDRKNCRKHLRTDDLACAYPDRPLDGSPLS